MRSGRSRRPVTVATGALSSEYGRVDDFNDDGLPDVALGTNDGAFTVMRGDGRRISRVRSSAVACDTAMILSAIW